MTGHRTPLETCALGSRRFEKRSHFFLNPSLRSISSPAGWQHCILSTFSTLSRSSQGLELKKHYEFRRQMARNDSNGRKK